MKYLALDIGSSFIKYALIDLDKKKIGEVGREPAPQPCIRTESRYEISSEAIWKIVEEIITKTVKHESDLRGIVFCTQMHGFLIANDRGEAITSFISWQDRRCTETDRGVSPIEELRQLGYQKDMQCAGVTIQPHISMCNLYALLQKRNFHNESIHFCTLGSWLIWRMTGNHICHITNGAPTGLVDIVEGRWNNKLIARLGFDHLHFPTLSNGLECCGTYQVLDREISIYPDFGDHQACVLGSAVHKDTDVNISIGTAGLLGIVTDNHQLLDGEVRPYFDGLYLHTKRGLFGGRDLTVLVDFLKDALEHITGTNGWDTRIWEVFCQDSVNDYSDAHLPRINARFYTNGEIANITSTNFRFLQLIESVYKEVASDYKNALLAIFPKEKKIDRVIFSGGAGRKNKWLKNCIAQEFGCAWEDSPVEDEAILGLFRLALVCSGFYDSTQDAINIESN